MGVVDIETAMKAAREDNLDPGELVPDAKPAVCKNHGL
jgi:translation initiation factor IF-3